LIDKTLNTSIQEKRIDRILPFVLLILAGVIIFATENFQGGFIPGGFYGGISIHGLTLSKNLMNGDHHLFMYASREIRDDKAVYDAYNRFPVFPFLMTGWVLSIYKFDIYTEIYIARQLMNLLFFLSMIVMYKLILELVENKYLALSVVLVTFSSYYMLSYKTLLFNDTPALLGFVIALTAVVKLQNVKLKISHLFIYSLLPICLGWQPYSVFFVWFLIDAIEMFINNKGSIKAGIFSLIKQPSTIITSSAVLWGVLILTLQLLNEWRIVGGSFSDLPSVGSALWRSGISSAEGYTQYIWLFDWLNYLPNQAHAIAIMIIPFWPIFQVEPGLNASIFIILLLIIYFFIKYLKERNSINKVYLIMIFSGFFWMIIMKNFVALHEFQSIFYIGFTAGVFITFLSRLNPVAWKILSINITVGFLITVTLSNHLKTPNVNMNRLISQFQSICYQLPVDSKVYFEGDRKRTVEKYAIDFLLVGRSYVAKEAADYVISKNPDFPGERLTSNPEFNLFKIGPKKSE